MELHKQIDKGIPPSAWQMHQIYQVIADILEVFAETTGMAKGVSHKIHTDPGVMVQAPRRPIPLALQRTIECKVQTKSQLRVIEPSRTPGRAPRSSSQSPMAR